MSKQEMRKLSEAVTAVIVYHNRFESYDLETMKIYINEELARRNQSNIGREL